MLNEPSDLKSKHEVFFCALGVEGSMMSLWFNSIPKYEFIIKGIIIFQNVDELFIHDR